MEKRETRKDRSGGQGTPQQKLGGGEEGARDREEARKEVGRAEQSRCVARGWGWHQEGGQGPTWKHRGPQKAMQVSVRTLAFMPCKIRSHASSSFESIILVALLKVDSKM